VSIPGADDCRQKTMRKFVCALIVGLITAAGNSASGRESAWVMEQHSEESGDHLTYLSAKGLKSVNNSKHLTTVLMAPTWRMVLFSDSHKTYYETTYATWKSNVAQRMSFVFGEDIPKYEWKLQSTTEQKDGHKALLYTVIHDAYSGKNFMGQAHVRKRVYWLANDIAVDPMVANTLARILGFPELDKIPLAYAGVYQERYLTALKTLSIHEIKNTSQIKYPDLKGYKRLKTEESMYNDQSHLEDTLRTFF
jgi:hypothetical protein